MPPRPDLLAKRLSTFDLPILPFLAPRVFQPWPARGLRTLSRPRAARRDAVSHEATRDIGRGVSNRGGSTSRVWGPVIHLPTPAQIEGQQHLLQVEQESEELAEGRITQSDGVAGVAEEDSARHTGDSVKLLRLKAFRKPYTRICKKLGAVRRRQSRNVLLCAPWKAGKQNSLKRSPRGLVKTVSSKRPIRALPRRGHSSPPQRALARRRVQRRQELPEEPKNSLAPMSTIGWYRYRSLRPSSEGRLVCNYSNFMARLSLTAMHCNRAFSSRKRRYRRHSITKRCFPKSVLDQYINCESSTSLREAWENISTVEKAHLWPELVLTTLRDSPAAAMKVLVGTYTKPYPHGGLFSGILDYLIHFHLGYDAPSEDNAALELLDAISWLLKNGPRDYIMLSQSSIYLLLKHLPTAEIVEKFFGILHNYDHPLHYHTLMHFADRFAKAGEMFRDKAFDIMQIIGGLGNVDFNKSQMMSLCTTWLMASGQMISKAHRGPPFGHAQERPVQTAKYSHTEVFEYLLKCGMKPNIITYNVLIYKTLAAREAGGWEIYNLMKENGIEPNAYTYSILLNDAKSRHDFPAIRHITTAIRERSLWCEHILADSLHAMFLSYELRHRSEVELAKSEQRQPIHGTATVFEQMLPVYCEYFEFGPLAHLVPGVEDLYRHITKSESGPPQEKHLFAATPPIFVIMLTSLLRSFDDPDTPKIFYDHFSKLVRENDPLVASLAKQSEVHFRHIYNMVIFALGQHASAIPQCLKVIADMSVKHPEPADGEAAPLRPAKPDVSTWSIMISIFGKHRQARAAEKVLEMMRQRGIEPNTYTWHSLLHVYTGMQETRMSMDVLERLQAAGYEINKHTWAALHKLRDRRALIEGIQTLEANREQREIERIEALRKEVMDGAEDEATLASEHDANATQDRVEFVVRDMPVHLVQRSHRVLRKKSPTFREQIEILRKVDEAREHAAPRGVAVAA